MNEAKLKFKANELRPMATGIIDSEIKKGSEMKIFKILRAAGKRITVTDKKDDPKRDTRMVTVEDLRKWFGKGPKGDWVRVGTDGKIKGDCAREPGEGKPKCMPRDKAHSMSKKDRASSARRKRRADPNPDRPGTGNKPIMVKTDKKESVDMNESRLKVGDKVKTPQGTVEIIKYDTRGMRGKQDDYEMILHMKDGKKVSMGSHPQPTASAVTNIAKRHFSKGIPKYFAHMTKESVEEARQMKDPKKDVMVVKNKKVIVIDKGKEKEYLKKGWQLAEKDLEEKNVPTNPALWAKMKAQAKAKFDVYPSAYANGWAAKKYKAAGGGWKTESVKEMKSFWDMRESLELNENYRTLAMHGMGTEKKGEARVGLEMDYYDKTGSKRMGKIVKLTPKGYVVRDDKDGKSHTFAFHDRAKAKDLLAKHGKGKYNESVELEENKYPMASKWRQGAKNVKGQGFEFVRSRDGVHTIKKNGKAVGDFSLEDDSGLWVINLNGVRGQVTADEIDDIPRLISNKIKESVELEEKHLAKMAMRGEATRTALDRKITNDPKKMTQTQRDNEIAVSMHNMRKGREKARGGRPMGPRKAARVAAYRQSQIDRGLRKEGLGENQTKAHLRAKSKLLGGAKMMDLERAGNAIRAYAKKSGGIDKKDFDTAADYVISLGRLTDANKVGKVLQDLQIHVGLLDTDVRDKIKDMLPTGLKKKV